MRVTVRQPALRALTKAGYFALDQRAPVDARQQTMASLAEGPSLATPSMYRSTIWCVALTRAPQRPRRLPLNLCAQLTHTQLW